MATQTLVCEKVGLGKEEAEVPVRVPVNREERMNAWEEVVRSGEPGPDSP